MPLRRSRFIQSLVIIGIALVIAVSGCSSNSTGDVKRWPKTSVIDVATSSRITTEDFIEDKVTLINLWALWCAPCREELPRLQNVSENYGEDISVIGINIGDDLKKTTSYIQEAGLLFPMYWDESGDLLTALKIPSVPATLAVDPDGKITWFHLGALSEQELKQQVERLTQ